MSTFWLTAYVLIWPLIASGVFLTLCVALIIDMRAAKKSGKSLV
ncbi:putative transporter small subunit [Aliidiomarina taiwanensis]|nr:putative transporter small subunit [Aliidiomarina taiwanensis]